MKKVLRLIGMLFAVICSGIDFLPTHRSKPGFQGSDFYNLLQPKMDEAFRRIRKRPLSFLHEWVNVFTSYMETSSQEEPAKLVGFMFLLWGLMWFLIGLAM